MTPGEPYTAGELAEEFDAKRHTIWRRLEGLVEKEFVNKKKHAENRVSYWVPEDDAFPGGKEDDEE
jgi:DNA-binding MarR family transcriptional regulator